MNSRFWLQFLTNTVQNLRLMILVGEHEQIVQSCYCIHTCTVLCKLPLQRAWQRLGQDISLLWWSFGAGIGSMQLWQTAMIFWLQIRFRCGNFTRVTLDAKTSGSRQGCGLHFLASGISSCASGSGMIRSVHCCKNGNTAKQSSSSVNWLMSHMSFVGRGETGKSIWWVSKCSQKFTVGKWRFCFYY